jgi:hypothetical protein
MIALVRRDDGTAWLEGRLADARDVLDLIGAGYGLDALLVLPVGQLDPAFLDLRSGLMGELAQKLANYGMRAAILGDTAAAETSRAFRDFRRETNRGRVLVFAADEAALAGLA